MAICNIIETPGRTQEEYDLVGEHMRGSGPVPPEGCRLAVLGREHGITVWDSREDRDHFLAERLGPAFRAAGRSLDEVEQTEFEVDTLIAGDLVGKAVGAEASA
jgi:hypothetical protein